MARVAGVDPPAKKRLEIALTYIYTGWSRHFEGKSRRHRHVAGPAREDLTDADVISCANTSRRR